MCAKRFTEDSYRKEPWFRSLVSAFLQCKTEEEIASFLRDVGTLGELQAWSERFEVAKLLAQGFSYRDVAAKTGASTTTVTRVARFIENGEGGYRKVLNVHRHHRLIHAKPENVHTQKERTLEEEASGRERSGEVLQKYLSRLQKGQEEKGKL